jgi:hypothetical protein
MAGHFAATCGNQRPRFLHIWLPKASAKSRTRSKIMFSDSLFDAPDDDNPEKPEDREKQENEHNRHPVGGEYILHFRDSLGRFTDPPLTR